MKKSFARFLAAFLAVIMVLATSAVCPFAADADIALKASSTSCVQGDEISVQVYFPSDYNEIAALDFTLNYDSSKLEVVSVTKGAGYVSAYDKQTNGSFMSENHATAGKIVWSMAGSNNYDFSGVFSDIVFKVKQDAMHGDCDVSLNVIKASNSGYVDMTSTVDVSGCAFTIIRNTENDLRFIFNSDQTGYIITSYLCGTCDYVNIPAEHNGLPVVGIGPTAFSGHSEIKTITIPETIESIGFQSFYNCTGIEEITIPNSVTYIDGAAFMNCTSLKKVNMSVALEEMDDNVFNNCNKLTSIELPFTLTKIGDRVFYNCSSLKDVRISKNTTSIGTRAFSGCDSELEFTTVSGNTYLPQYVIDNDLEAKITNVKDFSLGSVKAIAAQQYTGKKIEPSVTVTLESGTRVVLGKDYKVVYVNNSKNNTTAKAYVIGIDGYEEGYLIEFEIKCFSPEITRVLGRDATCTREGYYDCKCETCGEEFKEVIPAKGHTSDTWIFDKLPTIYKTGIKHKVCSVCGVTYDKNTVADKIYPDVNGDKVINSSDALAVLQYATGTKTAIRTPERRLCADTNGDGNINSMDALAILQITIGSIVIANPYA